jgi:2-phosphosulfolactate phosphatase
VLSSPRIASISPFLTRAKTICCYENSMRAGSERRGVRSLEVLFSPVEFAALDQLDLSETVCVVFDVLRATSSMVTALSNGAKAIIPVMGIPEALSFRSQQTDVFLAGEREGVRIPVEVTGGIAFDLGNSPREFKNEIVAGKTIVMTTTNGTRALRACAHAKRVIVASFLNLRAVADCLEEEATAHLLLVCSGTKEEPAYEDALCAGALCDLLWGKWSAGSVSDSALIARKLYCQERQDLLAAVSQSRNGRRLLSIPELREDVRFCVQRDVVGMVLEMNEHGQVMALSGPASERNPRE